MLMHVSDPAGLGPPRMLSLIETRDDTHPKPLLINIPPLLWPVWILSQWTIGFQNNNNNKNWVNAP